MVVFFLWPKRPPETVWDRKVTETARDGDPRDATDGLWEPPDGVGDGPNDTDRLGKFLNRMTYGMQNMHSTGCFVTERFYF